MAKTAPFSILIDTREQTPWSFEGLGVHVPTIRRTLYSGDYSMDGMDALIAVERKSAKDLIGTVTSGRDRFERELERLQHFDFSAVVIEADWAAVQKLCYATTSMNPVSLDSSILTFSMRYPRTHFIYRPSRFAAMKTTYKLFDLFFRRIKNGKK